MPLTGEAVPFSKEQQLARGDRRHHRKVASAKTWQKIVDEKNGLCRCALLDGCAGALTYHHVVPRKPWGGDDVAANIVPVCDGHHRFITARNHAACAALLEALTDDEYEYAARKGGPEFFERTYGVAYERSLLEVSA